MIKQINLKTFKHRNNNLISNRQNKNNIQNQNSYLQIQQKNNIKISNILNYLTNLKYDKAIKEINNFIQNNLNITNDIITSFLTGIINLKNNDIDNYMLKLLKLLSNQHLKNKLNLDNSVINLLYRTLIYLLQDTLLKNILTNDYQRNKLTITNFHCLILVYISIGYIFCKDNDNIKEKELKDILKELIRQSQSKEKNHFKKCHVCIEINKIIDTNNLIISINESMSSYKNAIRINNNCLSAQRLMEECHLITKVKGQNEILSLQHYILNANKQQKNNSISINKKNNFNDTYDMLKTSFSSISESLINQKILKTTENNELKYKVNKKKKYDFNKSISIQSLSNTIERLENNNMKILDYKKVNSRNEKENFSPPPLPKIKIDNNKINNYINNIQTGILKLENDFNNFKTFTENTKKQIKLYTFLEFPKKNK